MWSLPTMNDVIVCGLAVVYRLLRKLPWASSSKGDNSTLSTYCVLSNHLYHVFPQSMCLIIYLIKTCENQPDFFDWNIIEKQVSIISTPFQTNIGFRPKIKKITFLNKAKSHARLENFSHPDRQTCLVVRRSSKLS